MVLKANIYCKMGQNNEIMVDPALVRCGFYNAICCHMPKTQQKKSDTVAHCSRCALRSSIAYRRNNFIFLRSNKVIKTPENKWYL